MPKGSQVGNTQLISTLNSRLVLQAVRVMQPTFRADVARRTGLKPATVTSIVNDLLAKKLLREIPATELPAIRFGRPPLMLEINRDARRILSIDLEPDHIRVAVTDLEGAILHYQEQDVSRFEQPSVTIAAILKLSKTALQTIGRHPLLGVGIALPGLIDSEKRVLISSTNMPQWHNVPIGHLLEVELRAPVRVERSIHLAALYEKWVNPKHQSRTILIISLRTGVGMSLLRRGQLYVGRSGLSGEIGHTIVDINGRVCECGSRGCLETFVSPSAIIERAQHQMRDDRGKALAGAIEKGEALSPELIYRLAREGDGDCGDIVRDVGRYLGVAVSNMINLLAPDEVIIAGAIDTAEELLLTSIREQVKTSALLRSRQDVVIRAASEKEKLPLLGAAVLVAQELFDLPELRHADMAAALP